MEQREVVIVGGGPAGLKCAEVLAKKHKDVLVLERGGVLGDKVCAGGLTLKDLKLGIPDRIIQRKFKKIILHTPLQDTEIRSDKPFLATIDRKDLGKWMADCAKKAGAEIQTNSEVVKIDNSKVVLANGENVEYKYLIGADGANSVVRKFLKLKNNNVLQAFQYIVPERFKNLEVFLDPEKFGVEYLWIFPYKNTASIGTGADLTKEVKQPIFGLGMQKLISNFKKWSKQRFELRSAKFQAHTINYDYQGHEFGNKFLVGDAGGFTSGLSGEGIYNAIKSGEDVAKRILNKKYKYKSIKQILKVKKHEEKLLRRLESSKTLSKIQCELFALLLKIRWIDNQLIKKL